MVLAVADFRIKGFAKNGHEINETVHAELSESRSFSYGSRMSMTMEWSDGTFESYDTRYDDVSAENFVSFAQNVLKNRVLDGISVEVIS